jgi:hypothetical protein
MFIVASNIASFIKPEIISLIPSSFDLEIEFFKILALAFIMPMITFFGLLVKYKTK